MQADPPSLELHWIRGAPGELRGDNQPVIKQISAMIKSKQREQVVSQLSQWSLPDIIELLVHLPLKRARTLHAWLPRGPATNVIATINPRLRAVLMASSTVARQVEIINRLDLCDAVMLLSQLPRSSVEAILPQLEQADEIEARLNQKADSVKTIMDQRFVAVPSNWTVSQVIDEIRGHASEIKKLDAIYVIDSERRLVGMVKLYELLLQPSDQQIGAVMRDDVVSVSAAMDQEAVLRIAETHDLVTIPVTDDDQHLIGRITVRELLDIMRIEAGEDINIMSGVAATAAPYDSIFGMFRARFVWLIVGMIGSVLGAMIIMQYEEALEEAAILAAFIPLVAATAGNAGIQSSAVAVQSLAFGSPWNTGLLTRLAKEFSVALINGLGAALLVALFVFSVALLTTKGLENPKNLAVTIGAALVVVITVATLMGAAMPLLLDRIGINPAVATGPFITVSNDVIGIFVYFLSATFFYFERVGT